MGHWIALLIAALSTSSVAHAQPADSISWIPTGPIVFSDFFVSPDGRYVTWTDDIRPGDPSAVYVFDRRMGRSWSVPLPMRTTDPILAFAWGYYEDAAGPGIVFVSGAQLMFDSDMTMCTEPAEDCNFGADVYMVPITGGRPFRVSLKQDGHEEASGRCKSASVSADGSRVAFVADRYTEGDTNGFDELYVRVLTGAGSPRTVHVTRDTGGGFVDGVLDERIAISPDGRFVAFVSAASDLVAGDTNGTWDVFVANIDTGAIERVSVRSDGTQVSAASGGTFGEGPEVSISYDGRYVAFSSMANDLVGDDTNDATDVFVRDRGTNETTMATAAVACPDDPFGGTNTSPAISYDGSVVAFRSTQTCFTPFFKQAVVVNRLTGDVSTVSVPIDRTDPMGEANGIALSGDGTRVVFSSTSRRLSMPGPDPGGDPYAHNLYYARPFGDQDGDGLLDLWEDLGLDIGGDGTIDLDLAALGARSDHLDLFVEVDYLRQMGAMGHTHRPSAIALSQIEAAFRGAPIGNPDGSSGVNIHFAVGDAIAEDAMNSPLASFTGFDPIKDRFFATAQDRAAGGEDRVTARRMVFRYALMAHQRQGTTSSGLAELPGNDFIVSLGAFDSMVGTVDEQAGTIMHELGHTLELRHGGGDHVNCKPNYLSVMSYAFQFPYLAPSRPLDYSRDALRTLREDDLNEPSGVGGPMGSWTVFGPPPVAGSDADMAIDWNRDLDSTDGSTSANVNDLGFGGCDSTDATQVLVSHDDWDEILFDFRRTADFGDGAHGAHDDEEVTREIADAMRAVSPMAGNAPPLAVVGEPLMVDEESTIDLDGSRSSDPEGAPITFTWLQGSGPEGELTMADTARPRFTAPRVDEDTTVEIDLAVHDGMQFGVGAVQQLTVIDRGGPPVGDGGADAGADSGAVDAGTDGGGDGSIDDDEEDDGCGCVVGGARSDFKGAVLALVAIAALVRRRRRRRRTSR